LIGAPHGKLFQKASGRVEAPASLDGRRAYARKAHSGNLKCKRLLIKYTCAVSD